MHYLLVSLSHKNADLETREKFTYSDEEKEGCLKRLVQSSDIGEAMLLNTCNRMEIFIACSDIENALNHMMTLLTFKGGLTIDEIKNTAKIVDDSSAIQHLFAVASSIDSMVVGETQIAGQIKDAFRFAKERGYAGKKISRAISHAFKCAAKVRNATDISSKPVSVASVALSQVKKLIPSLSGKKALVIGVGEMSEICAKHLVSEGVQTFVTNRTRKNAEQFACDCGVEVFEFGELHQAVNQFDIIFSATSASYPIITEDMVEEVEFKRFWFDLAIPRDIEIAQHENIYHFVVDDIKEIVEANKHEREQYVRKAYGIVGRSVVEFFEWLDALNVEPLIKEIYQKANKAVEEEMQRALKKGFLPKELEYEATKMAQQAMKRFLHDMTKKMREASTESKTDSITGAMQYIANASQDNIPDQYKHLAKKD